MAYERPTFALLQTQILADVTSSGLPGVDGLLRISVFWVLSWVLAAVAYGLYGYLDYTYREAIPFTAEDEQLLAWGALKDVEPTDATFAGGTVGYTGGTPTTLLPSGTTITRGDGFAYTTTANATVAGDGTVSAPITATAAGSIGNAAAGTALALGSPIAGIVSSTGTASAAIVGGADQEQTEAYRTRVLTAFANPPQGGDAADYVNWALAVPGVTRAWCLPNGNGIGSVIVYPMLDVANAAYGGLPQGINGVATGESRSTPATGDQLTIANAIFTKRPVTALVYVEAPVVVSQSWTITNLSPNTGPIVAGIEAALADMALRLGYPKNVIFPSDWNEAIASVPGIIRYNVTSPAAPITMGANQIMQFGTLTATGD